MGIVLGFIHRLNFLFVEFVFVLLPSCLDFSFSCEILALLDQLSSKMEVGEKQMCLKL